MSVEERAKQLFLSGANCAQAVLGAFAQELGLTEEQACRLGSGFGAGMGRMREVCGAFSALVIISNWRCGPEKYGDKAGKDRQYRKIQQLSELFKAGSGGSIVCRELLGLTKNGGETPISNERTPEYYRKRPCLELVALAARLAESEGDCPQNADFSQ